MTCAIVLATAFAPARLAHADDKPTPEQMAQAKSAYTEGVALHDQGKLPEAIEKFKESYRLSRNPVLLYNIAFTMDEAKQDLALFYYQKFLKDAPANAAQRPSATERVKQLEKEKLDASLGGGSATPPMSNVEPGTKPPVDTTKPPVDTTKPPVDHTPKPPVAIKPAGTYHAEDFQHQVVEEAPPGKPLDVSAFVPEDSGFTVTLFYRSAGESKFATKPMKWRYKELVGRIPAAKMTGSAIQYYVEVKDTTGEVVTRSGKSTSPNLVNLDAAAPARFYPDLDDKEGGSSVAEQKHQDDDDPLHGNTGTPKHIDSPIEPQPEPGVPGNGFRDVGSQKFKYGKWGATLGGVTLLGVSAIFYVQAQNQASALLLDTSTTAAGMPCLAPCHKFDSFDADIQSAGKRDQTIANVTLGVGIAAGLVAGYYWYRELTHKHATGDKAASATAGGSPEAALPTWMIGPTAGDGFSGAAAMGKF